MKETKKPTILLDTSLPIIGQPEKKTPAPLPVLTGPDGKPVLNQHGAEKFARKEPVAVIDPNVLSQARIVIPPIYYWEDVDFSGSSSMMTMAFQWNGQNWGEALEIPAGSTVDSISVMRKQLFGKVKETLDVLVHHGSQVLDSFGNIDMQLVNDQEAIRWKHDKYWKHKVAAFNKLVRIAPITRARAVQLKLLDEAVL